MERAVSLDISNGSTPEMTLNALTKGWMVLRNICAATYNLTSLVKKPISEGIDDSSLFSATFLCGGVIGATVER